MSVVLGYGFGGSIYRGNPPASTMSNREQTNRLAFSRSQVYERFNEKAETNCNGVGDRLPLSQL